MRVLICFMAFLSALVICHCPWMGEKNMILSHLKLWASVYWEKGQAWMEIAWIPKYQRTIWAWCHLTAFQLIVSHCFYIKLLCIKGVSNAYFNAFTLSRFKLPQFWSEFHFFSLKTLPFLPLSELLVFSKTLFCRSLFSDFENTGLTSHFLIVASQLQTLLWWKLVFGLFLTFLEERNLSGKLLADLAGYWLVISSAIL